MLPSVEADDTSRGPGNGAPASPHGRYARCVARSEPVREGRGVAGGIGAMILFGFVLLPAILVPVLFLFLTIMGMIKGTDVRASTLNLPVLFTGVALVVTTLVVLVLAGVGLIGRSLTPKKRARD
jgi:hypothetical protein